MEKIFYNPIFKDANMRPLTIPRRCEREHVFTYGKVADEYIKQCLQLPHKSHVANVHRKIIYYNIVGKIQHTIFLTRLQARINFRAVTFKDVYEEFLRLNYLEHHSLDKWDQKFHTDINWSKVWEALNNPITKEKVRTAVWEQIHLNDYCTYSYNKWHKTQDPCPLCLNIPTSKFHLTLDCPLTQKLWQDLAPYLNLLYTFPVTDQEKVFGITGDGSPSIILRNWLTFNLRNCIVEQEQKAYHNKKGKLNEQDIKRKFNDRIKSEVMEKYRIYENLGRLDYFEKIFAVNDFLIVWENNWWQIATLYQC